MKSNNNKKAKPEFAKPVTKTLDFVVIGYDQNGNEYDADSAKDLVADLQASGTFDKLSVMATISRSTVLNKEDAHGVMSIARVMKYNKEAGSIDLLFFGKNATYANNITDNMVVVPRVRLDRETNKAVTILGFEIIAPTGDSKE